MQHDFLLILTILKTATVILGTIFLYYTWKAFRKHRSRQFAWLLIAMGLLTMAAVSEGAALQVLRLDLGQAHIVEAIFTLAGFAVLVYSVMARRRRTGAASSHREDEETFQVEAT